MNLQKNSFIGKVGLIIVCLFSIHFWKIIYIPQKYNAQDLLTWLVCLFCFMIVAKREELRFRNAIILFFLGIFSNIISAYVNQGQGPYETFLSFNYYYFILVYFFLHYFKFTREYIEKVIIVFALIYSILYIIQVEVYPYQFMNVDMNPSRGTIRLRIEGNGFLMLAYFLMLNRYFLNRKLKDVLLALGFFIILLMGGFRTLTFMALILSALMFLKVVPFNIRNYALLVFIGLLFFGLFQFKGTGEILNGMVGATEELTQQGEKYIRVTELKYFLQEYPQNILYYIFGGGLPGSSSVYAYQMGSVAYDEGLFWVDLGLIGFYIIVGAVALCGLLWYTIKAILIKLPTDRIYLNFYFLYLLVVSFTTMEIFREGIFVVEAIGLYMIDISLENTTKPGIKHVRNLPELETE
jgi:hypothetical protein